MDNRICILELDDFCDEFNCLPILQKYKTQIPNLKVTLFTIPYRTSQKLLDEVKQFDWIQLALHGYDHNHPMKPELGTHEFAFLNYMKAGQKIMKGYNKKDFVKGFKAPGWQISLQTMQFLRDNNFWLTVQWSDSRHDMPDKGQHQPAVIDGLQYVAANEVDTEKYIYIHGHTWDCAKNYIEKMHDYLLTFNGNRFIFIDDYIKNKSNE